MGLGLGLGLGLCRGLALSLGLCLGLGLLAVRLRLLRGDGRGEVREPWAGKGAEGCWPCCWPG